MSICRSDHRVIQVIEPDSTVLTATSSGSMDASLEEAGQVDLAVGQPIVEVVFVTPKASNNYRFEYLYVDAFGQVNPGNIDPMPVDQNSSGFMVDLAGTPPVAGYVLRWRVVVGQGGGVLPLVDVAETIYLRLPQANFLQVLLINPRSDASYGFTELRVENLDDPQAGQSPILIQVTAKNENSFSISLSPTPPTDNYFLVARIP